MFTAETEKDFLEGIVAALPPKDKGRMAPRVRKLQGNTGLLVDALLEQSPLSLDGFSRNENATLFQVGGRVLESFTGATPLATEAVSTGWQGNIDTLVSALHSMPEGLGVRFATALSQHPEAHMQVLLLATGRSVADKTPCSTLKDALGKGKIRDAILSCLQSHVRGVAEAK